MTQRERTAAEGWRIYYQTQTGRPPREFLQQTHARFSLPGQAIDLGCGNGMESVFLLLKGWRVLAIDQEALAIQLLQRQVTPQMASQLQTEVAPFQAVELPPADLIWAGLSLPFCAPDQFGLIWPKIQEALQPGGRFAGDFFGPRHVWAEKEEMTFHTRPEVLALFTGCEVEYLVEEEGLYPTTFSGLQPWHMFTVCARRE